MNQKRLLIFERGRGRKTLMPCINIHKQKKNLRTWKHKSIGGPTDSLTSPMLAERRLINVHRALHFLTQAIITHTHIPLSRFRKKLHTLLRKHTTRRAARVIHRRKRNREREKERERFGLVALAPMYRDNHHLHHLFSNLNGRRFNGT